jgi:hypothetical protein
MASPNGVLYVIYNSEIHNNGAKSLDLFHQGYDLLRYDLYSYITNAGYLFEKDIPERCFFNLADKSDKNISNYRNYTKNYSMEKDLESVTTLYSSSYLSFDIVLYQDRENKKQYLPVVSSSDLYDVKKTLTTLPIRP